MGSMGVCVCPPPPSHHATACPRPPSHLPVSLDTSTIPYVQLIALQAQAHHMGVWYRTTGCMCVVQGMGVWYRARRRGTGYGCMVVQGQECEYGVRLHGARHGCMVQVEGAC